MGYQGKPIAVVFFLIGLIGLFPTTVAAQDSGLIINTDDAWPGYTLFAPTETTTTYLIANDGTTAWSWASDFNPGVAAYLTEEGYLLRAAVDGDDDSLFSGTGGIGGRVQLIYPDGSGVWDYQAHGDYYHQHHDLERLPNGNILMIIWEYKTSAEAEAAGRNPDMLSEGSLWPDKIVEVRPEGTHGGEIVWQWRVWDHLIQDYDSSKPNYGPPADNPQRINLNFIDRDEADWTHINAVAYNPELDQVILSVHNFSEVWIIDHSTTTEEAASSSGGRCGRGGDLLYRWGNPQTYDSGDDNDQKLFGQHDAWWIPAGYPGQGDIILFNNGLDRTDGDYSTVDQFTPPLNDDGSYAMDGATYGPGQLTWIYQADPATDMYSMTISGAQRLPNGDTLITVGESGEFIEATSAGETVWNYVNPYGETEDGSPESTSGNNVFKARRYDQDYSGVAALGLY